jgi:hypothetical protein
MHRLLAKIVQNAQLKLSRTLESSNSKCTVKENQSFARPCKLDWTCLTPAEEVFVALVKHA